jgi:hypothetical protein
MTKPNTHGETQKEICSERDGCDCVHCRRYVAKGGKGPIVSNGRPTFPFYPFTLAPKKRHGGPGRNQGRKAGPNGPASARLNIKCRPDDLAAWKKQAELSLMSLSALVKIRMNARMPRD